MTGGSPGVPGIAGAALGGVNFPVGLPSARFGGAGPNNNAGGNGNGANADNLAQLIAARNRNLSQQPDYYDLER